MDVLLLILGLLVGLAAGWTLATYAARARERLLLHGSDLADLVTPLRDSLTAVRDQLAEVERGRLESDVALRLQVDEMRRSSEQVRTEANQLVTALRAPQVRGRWGEMQLRRVVEAAGMTEHIDFIEQPTTDDGRLRPDLLVRLTSGRTVLVDSKVAFNAYLEAGEARDEATRDARLKAHARALRTHVDQLAAKQYWSAFAPTPEFVVCFVPADPFLDAALGQDPALLEHAFERNVVLATPSTLVALLRTVAYTWRQRELASNADEVHRLGKELYERLTTLGGHFAKLGRSLAGAVDAYNDAMGSLERRVLSKARQLQSLGVVGPGASIAPLAPLTDAVPRDPPGFTEESA